MRLHSAKQGQAAVEALFATMVFLLLVAGVYDVYAAYTARDWGYEIASESARRGVIEGQEWPPTQFYHTGAFVLNPHKAKQKAKEHLLTELNARGIPSSDYSYDIRVLPNGGHISGFPPQGRANQITGSANWNESYPSVSVYLQLKVPTAFLGLISRSEYDVHVFAAAEAVAQP